MKALTEQQQIKLIDGQFSVNPDYSAERTGDYEIRDRVAAKWKNYSSRVAGCGNCHHEFLFNIKNQTFEFTKESVYRNDNYISMYRIISPALLLYRLIATFFGSPKCEDGYKSIWEYNLLHKPTGKSISFSEWKGAVGFWLTETDSDKLTIEFKADLIELMNYLISEKCAHPYDNLVAGNVA